MQGIVSSMLWPAGDAPGERQHRSPWIDARFSTEDVMLAQIDALPHRRYIKTHSAADCTPIFDECKYVTVYRDGRDSLMSWWNHRRSMRPALLEFLNSTAAEDSGITPLDPYWAGDMDELLDEWVVHQSPVTHLASWWPLRDQPFVCFVHYNDLMADLEGEMRRLAAFLEIDVPESMWGRVVERCGLSQMRDASDNEAMSMVFEGGAASFFYKGTNGRWRDVLTPAQLERYERLVADGLPADAARWLEHGSLAIGRP